MTTKELINKYEEEIVKGGSHTSVYLTFLAELRELQHNQNVTLRCSLYNQQKKIVDFVSNLDWRKDLTKF